jgi:hypothetical protein
MLFQDYLIALIKCPMIIIICCKNYTWKAVQDMIQDKKTSEKSV